jgi:hypothetical protein
MYCVAFIEVLVIQGRVTLGALTFQNRFVGLITSFFFNPCRWWITSRYWYGFFPSFLHPLFFAHFLRLRYYLSPQTRSAVSAVNRHIDHYLDHPSCPAMVKKGTNFARSLVSPNSFMARVSSHLDHVIDAPFSCQSYQITQYADSIISTSAAHPPGRTAPQTPNSVNNRTPNSG